MQDNRVRFSISVPWSALAAAAWAAMAGLLGLGAWTGDITWAVIGLALSAVAVTISMRCFLVRLDRNIITAYEYGQDSARATVRPLHASRD